MSPGIIRRTRVVFVSWLTLDFALHLLSDFVILPQDKKNYQDAHNNQCRLYLHWGHAWAPPAERGPSLENIYRVCLTADLCEG